MNINFFSQTHSSDQRSGLTAIRNAASVLSNISVYLVAWFFLGIRERPFDDDLISKDDAAAFRNIVLVINFAPIVNTLICSQVS